MAIPTNPHFNTKTACGISPQAVFLLVSIIFSAVSGIFSAKMP